ncbi:MAG TPA: hypothetical protein VMH36_07525 [Alphaproteobacteria bacterium]|nr:hypothetical protein [Alphaproteobacteria bacterium]
MRLYTPDKTELLVIKSVRPHKDGLIIEGTIMGAMPMKAILRPEELRRGFRLVSLRTIVTAIVMLFRPPVRR